MGVIRLWLLAGLLVSQLVADTERELIERSIIGYNHGIMKAAKTGNPDTLRHLCEDEQYIRATVWVKSWHDSSVYMDAKLDTITFGEIKRRENRAAVEAKEKWFFRYLYIEDEREAYPEKEISYKVRYNMVYKGKRWKVESIDILEEKHDVEDPRMLIRPVKKETEK